MKQESQGRKYGRVREEVLQRRKARVQRMLKKKNPSDVLYVLLKKNKIFRKDSIKIEYSKDKKNEANKDIGEGNKAENKTG